MRNFVCGLITGLTLAGAVGYAGQFYNRDGSPVAPSGSIQQLNYFRERQVQLDIAHMRRQADQDRLNRMTNPCAR
ncbi:MAG: hypothetical protein P0121_14385 [Nitrospira sp.]|nr:hypothetical protein [Nitrospira sp.]